MVSICQMNRYHRSVDLEMRHLRLVVAIAESGGVTRAGERLHLTQSALSHQLRDIEERLGAALFHRIGKKMVLTPAGEEVMRSATKVLDIVTRTEEGIRQSGGGRGGTLRISTQCYTCYHWLPSVLTEYRALHPKVGVEVDASSTPQPISARLDGRIDLAVVSDRVRDSRVIGLPLFDDDLVVITAPTHKLASRRFLVAEDFASETLIIYPPREESTILQQVLIPAGVTPAGVQQIALTEAIIELVKADLGIAVMARWAVRPYVEAGTLSAI